jgi:hypothetical protein
MKCSKIRTALLTFVLGFLSVPFITGLYDKWSEPYVEMPEVVSESPIIIRVCPEPMTDEEAKEFYREHGYHFIRQTNGINCNAGGGGGSGGRDISLEESVKSRGKKAKIR